MATRNVSNKLGAVMAVSESEMSTIANEIISQVATKELILNSVRMGTSDAIGYTLNENSVDLRTNKLKVQVAISIGNGQSISESTVLPVTVAKSFDSDNCLSVLHLPVIQLLELASNGLFELFNTNPKDSKQFTELCDALTNGFAYPSSYAQSLKKDPFSWAVFIGELNTMSEKGELNAAQIQQYTQAKAKAPKVRELSAFLTRAYDSDKWTWLKQLMDNAGYSVGVVSDDLEDLL